MGDGLIFAGPGKWEISQDKCLEGLSTFAIWCKLQDIDVKSTLSGLAFCDWLSGVRH